MVKILVVDDEPDLELLVRQRFRREVRDGRYELTFARNGFEALERLKEDPAIEIVLSDINMPEMDGLTLLTQIAELQNPVLKAVIVSAYGDMENIRTAMNRGAFDFVTKPIDFNDLSITLKKTMDQLATLRAALLARDQLVSIQRELSIAHRIQQSILPRSFPDVDTYELLAEMLPAREVGGDFYDFFTLSDGRIGVVVGDVSGKGVPAAIYMALCRALLKATAIKEPSPALCLSQVNRILCEESTSNLFVTVAYGALDSTTGELEYAMGGHPAPYLLRASGGVQELEGGTGPILGILENAVFTSARTRMATGDTFFLFTDGVTEAMDVKDDFFGDERLADLLGTSGSMPLAGLLVRTLDEVRNFAAGAAQSDDLTLLALRWRGNGAMPEGGAVPGSGA